MLLAVGAAVVSGNWNNFQGPLLYLAVEPAKYRCGRAAILNQSLSLEAPQWHFMMALATVMTIPILILYFLAQRQFLDGISVGAVKG